MKTDAAVALFYETRPKPSIVAIERETGALTIGGRMTNLAPRDLAPGDRI